MQWFSCLLHTRPRMPHAIHTFKCISTIFGFCLHSPHKPRRVVYKVAAVAVVFLVVIWHWHVFVSVVASSPNSVPVRIRLKHVLVCRIVKSKNRIIAPKQNFKWNKLHLGSTSGDGMPCFCELIEYTILAYKARLLTHRAYWHECMTINTQMHDYIMIYFIYSMHVRNDLVAVCCSTGWHYWHM